MDRDEDDDHIGPKTLILTICAAKVAVIGIVLASVPSGEGMIMAAIVSWYWIVPALAIFGGPALFRYRLQRVRAHRARLVRSEWAVGPDVPLDASVSPMTKR